MQESESRPGRTCARLPGSCARGSLFRCHMSSPGRFEVKIYDISASDLKKKTGLIIKGDFDKFKKFASHVAKRGHHPSWSTCESFNYSTQYADRLRYKKFVLEVKQKGLLSNDYIGGVSVDLHTLLTGPVAHSLALYNKKKKTGTLRFKCEMRQFVRLKVFFQSLAVFGLPWIRGREPSVRLQITITHPNHSKLRVRTLVQEETCDPEWDKIEQLRFATTFKELMATSLVVDVLHRDSRIGTCKLPFKQYASFSDGELLQVRQTIQMESKYRDKEGRAPTLRGGIYYNNFPNRAQMSAGLHTDNGVEDAVLAHAMCERPHGRVAYAKEAKKPAPLQIVSAERKGKEAADSSALPLSKRSVSPPRPRSASAAVRPGHIHARPHPPRSAVTPLTPTLASTQRSTNPFATEMTAPLSTSHSDIGNHMSDASSAAATTSRRTRSFSRGASPNGQESTSARGARVARVRPNAGGPVASTEPWYFRKIDADARLMTKKLGMPIPWSAHFDKKSQRVYYVNHETRMTTWDLPTSVRPPMPKPEPTAPKPRPPMGPRPVASAPATPAQSQHKRLHSRGTGTPGADTTKLQHLTSMGFSQSLSQEALLLYNGDTQRAASWLITQPHPLCAKTWSVRVDAKTKRVYYANNPGRFTQWTRPLISATLQPSLDFIVQSKRCDRRVAAETLAHFRGNVSRAVRWIATKLPKPLSARYQIQVVRGELVYVDLKRNTRSRKRPEKPYF